MSENDSFSGLLDLYGEGARDSAGAEIFARFTNRLVALARARLSDRMQTKVDPEDIVQSAYRSFFNRQAADQFELESWEGLWGLLAILTLRKCYARVDYFQAGKRDVRREVARTSEGMSVRSLTAKSTEPTPEEAAVLTELLEQTMSRLDPQQRDILSMTLQGYEVSEFSAHVRLSERTVHRVRKEIRESVKSLISGNS